jgi:hypothetical protein
MCMCIFLLAPIHVGNRKLSIENALQHMTLIREFPKAMNLAANDDNFHALIMIQVNMHRGNDIMVLFMLELHESMRELADMVVVDENDSCGNRLG